MVVLDEPTENMLREVGYVVEHFSTRKYALIRTCNDTKTPLSYGFDIREIEKIEEIIWADFVGVYNGYGYFRWREKI